MDEFDGRFAPHHPPPYYAAIYSSQIKGSTAVHERAAARVFRLAALNPGFIGAEMVQGDDGFVLAAIYWADRSGLVDWIAGAKAELARNHDLWRRTGLFENYRVRIVRVEDQEP